jgi:ATP-dependent DNA ligase
MLHGRLGNTITPFVFDVLAVEGLATTMQPYSERRALLEELDLEGAGTCGSSRRSRKARRFSRPSASAAWRAWSRSVYVYPYRPDERQWVKAKNRATARFAEERDVVGRRRGGVSVST